MVYKKVLLDVLYMEQAASLIVLFPHSDDSVSQTLSILKYVTNAITYIDRPKVVEHLMNFAAIKATKLAKDFGAMAKDAE